MRPQVARITRGFAPSCRCNGATVTTAVQPKRFLQINAYPIPTTTSSTTDAGSPASSLAAPTLSTSPDARFEVLGATSSLLSVALSASQNLFTRRGSLVGVSGPSPDNAVSTLSPLSPLTRAAVGIPFLYQKISSTTPVNLLVATKAQHTAFSVVHLDGRLDWIVAQRKGLVAWTGHTLSVKPSINLRMSLAHWGNTIIRGRGLIALAGTGQIFQVTLNEGEEYVAHPSNILAYTMNVQHPIPYRFKSSTLRLQLPSLGGFLSRYQFFRTMQTTQTWTFIANFIFTIRRWGRSTLFGDRLFLHFRGPQTILLQSRGSTIRDVLTARDVDEIADSPAGLVYGANGSAAASTSTSQGTALQLPAPPKMSFATVDKGRRVTWSQS